MSEEKKNELFIKHEKLIYYALKKLHIIYNIEEYYEEGLIGLAKAIKFYDKSKNIKESTYFYTCIHNEICKYITYLNEDIRKEVKFISMDKEIGENFYISDLISDETINFEKEIEQKEYEEYLYDLTFNLTPHQQKTFCKYFGLKEPMKNIPEISEEESVSKQCIQQRLQIAIKKIKKILEEENEIKR